MSTAVVIECMKIDSLYTMNNKRMIQKQQKKMKMKMVMGMKISCS